MNQQFQHTHAVTDQLPPGDLPIAIFFFQWLNGSQGPAVCDMLGYAEVMLAEFGDLGQMGNTNYLVMAGKLRQFATDHFRRAAADAGIDFIKNNCFHRIGCG